MAYFHMHDVKDLRPDDPRDRLPFYIVLAIGGAGLVEFVVRVLG